MRWPQHFCPCFPSCPPSVHSSHSSHKCFKMHMYPCLSPASNPSVAPICLRYNWNKIDSPGLHYLTSAYLSAWSAPKAITYTNSLLPPELRVYFLLPGTQSLLPLPFSFSRLMPLPSQCSICLCFFQEAFRDCSPPTRLDRCPLSQLSFLLPFSPNILYCNLFFCIHC